MRLRLRWICVENPLLWTHAYILKGCPVQYIFNSETFPLFTAIDTDELDSHVENFEEETIEFLIKVEETILDNE